MYVSALAFKDKRLLSQLHTLACTSDQFHSSWGLGLSHTSSIQTGPSLQRMGPDRGCFPSRYPTADFRSYQNCSVFLLSVRTSHNYLLLSSYVQTAVHKYCDIFGVRRDLSCKRASKKNPTQGQTCLLILKPTELELQSENI